ncbi:AsnC family transcriptional regulator, partial [Candidatus Woesearchaeota archaeon]|nr:AsnC family transcriptional regulator [Candidatus Woesearchaeota archaeon]
MELDVKDKKILAELSLNARQPTSAIAKKVRLSREGVEYRI